MVKVGDAVTFYDQLNVPRVALVTCVHSETYINVVSVSSDVMNTDPYGRQIVRDSSVPVKSEQTKAGRCFEPLQ